jgi:cell division protein FtsI/penicillin-binding protein 2
VSFEPEDRRVYPLDNSATYVVGSADTGGQGTSGAELAFNDEIRAAGARGDEFPLSIDLRVQGVLENELAAAAIANGQGRGRDRHRHPHRRGPGHGQLAAEHDEPGRRLGL